MMSNSDARKRQAEEACSTPGCPGDSRYAAPGRGHRTDCAYPFAASMDGLRALLAKYENDAYAGGSTVGLAAHEVPDLIEDWLAAHTNAAVEQARAEVNTGWVAKVEALADEWDHRYEAGDHMVGCRDGSGYYDLLADEIRTLTSHHTAALDAVKAEAARDALLPIRTHAESRAVTAKANGRDDRDWLDLLHLIDRAERHGGGVG